MLECPDFLMHLSSKVMRQKSSIGEEVETCLGECCQQGGSRHRRPSIVVWRMETLMEPDSILPVRSRWQNSDKLLLNQFQRVCCPFLSDQNYFPLLNTSVAYFQTRAHWCDGGTVSLALWMCTLMAVWSDKASVLTGQLWEVSLFLCTRQVWLLKAL